MSPHSEPLAQHTERLVDVREQILRQGLRIAREELGIARVLVTCDEDNIGSITTIEKNGGRPENGLRDPGVPKGKCRYWIEAE